MTDPTVTLKKVEAVVYYLHVSQHGVISGDLGEVGFQDGHGAGESHMATSTEQGHTGEAEDCSHQRRVRHPA